MWSPALKFLQSQSLFWAAGPTLSDGFYKHCERLPWRLSGKESACNAGDQVQSLGREDPLEEGMATYSSILAWRIPGTEEPGGLRSMGLHRVGHDCMTNPWVQEEKQGGRLGVSVGEERSIQNPPGIRQCVLKARCLLLRAALLGGFSRARGGPKPQELLPKQVQPALEPHWSQHSLFSFLLELSHSRESMLPTVSSFEVRWWLRRGGTPQPSHLPTKGPWSDLREARVLRQGKDLEVCWVEFARSHILRGPRVNAMTMSTTLPGFQMLDGLTRTFWCWEAPLSDTYSPGHRWHL